MYFFLILAFLSNLFGEELITNPSGDEGFGAQFQRIVYSVIYAELNNKKYLYTPFTNMEHNYDSDVDFLLKKEQLINFIAHFEINNEPRAAIPLSVDTCIKFFENNLEKCANSNSLKKIKEIFRLNKNKRDYFCDENFNIAVHVRRPNPHDNRLRGADIPDRVYLAIINQLRKEYSSKQPLFHIYSQGNVSSFEKSYKTKLNDIVFHINESIEKTFASMVFADVLVTSASSFSYVAALLSEGKIYYIPFWHPPLPGWIVLEKRSSKKW